MTPGQAAGLIVALSVIGLGLLASVVIVAIQECLCKHRRDEWERFSDSDYTIPIVRGRAGSWV